MDNLKTLFSETGLLTNSTQEQSPRAKNASREAMEMALSSLSPREEMVIKMRYGLGPDGKEHTLEEIGHLFAVTRERIRQIEAVALRKLRHPSRLGLLKRFFELAELDEEESNVVSIELIPVIETIKNLTPALIAYLRTYEADIERLRWDVFEHLIAEFFASWGFEDVRLVGRNAKTSADIFAAQVINPIGTKIRYFIEVKRWKHKVGVQVIDQVYGAMLSERPVFGWHAAMIVSLVGFKDFEKYSRESLALRGIELRERDDLLKWLRGYKPKGNGLWLPEPRKEL